jgi:hypothetical protein
MKRYCKELTYLGLKIQEQLNPSSRKTIETQEEEE